MRDYEQDYEDFWKEIVETNGFVNIDQVKRELSDYLILLDNVPKVYEHVTGGLVSKPLTDPYLVQRLADEYYSELFKEEDQ